MKFYISSNYGDSSIFEPVTYTHEKKILTRRFDHFYEELGLKNIKLLKLEAEGAEPEILTGCGKYLQNIEYISADLGFERGLKQDTTLPEVSNILIREGFKMISLNGQRLVALFKNKRY